MKRLYYKNELLFALLWIAIYVLLMSISDYFSVLVGIEKVFTAPIILIIAMFLLVWIKKEKLSEKYGLVKTKFSSKTYLWFIPLAITVSVNFWGGVCLQYTTLEIVLYIISMICVGIVEEIIFRGFLFKYLSKNNLTMAVIISSLTFGFGHIINLLSGAELLGTLLQVCYATAAGFAFTIIFYKSGSLLPCIVTHSLMNATSVFSCHANSVMNIVTAIVLIVVFVGYAFWVLRMEKTKQKNSESTENQ